MRRELNFTEENEGNEETAVSKDGASTASTKGSSEGRWQAPPLQVRPVLCSLYDLLFRPSFPFVFFCEIPSFASRATGRRRRAGVVCRGVSIVSNVGAGLPRDRSGRKAPPTVPALSQRSIAAWLVRIRVIRVRHRASAGSPRMPWCRQAASWRFSPPGQDSFPGPGP